MHVLYGRCLGKHECAMCGGPHLYGGYATLEVSSTVIEEPLCVSKLGNS